MPKRTIAALAAAVTLVSALMFSASPAAAESTASFFYNEFRLLLTSRCLDVGGQANGAVVQQFTCNGTVNQQWEEVPTDNGYFLLRVASSGRCLQVPGSSQANNAALTIADCTGAFNQQWRLGGNLDPIFRVIARHSGKCLSIQGESTDDRTRAVQNDCDSRNSEEWVVQRAAFYVAFERYQDIRCLDVGGQANGSIVQQYTCNGTVNQQWTRTVTDSGYAILSVASSGRCLQVPNSSQAEDAALNIADCTGAFNQQWQLVQVAGAPTGVMIWRVRHSGKCLSILGESFTDRVPAVQHTCKPQAFRSENWLSF